VKEDKEMPKPKWTAQLEWRSLGDGRTAVYWRSVKPGVGNTLVSSLAVFLILPLVALAFLSLGSGTVSVRCEKSKASVRCTVEEGFLFNAYVRKRTAREVREAALATSSSDEGDPMSRPVLETATGSVALEWASSNFGDYAKRAFVDEINAALGSGAGPFSVSFNKWNVFGYLGLLVALLFIWVAWAVVAHWLFPVFVEIDTRERVVRFRASAFRPWIQTWPFRRLKKIGLRQAWGADGIFFESSDGKRVSFGKGYVFEKSALEPHLGKLLAALGRGSESWATEVPDSSPFVNRFIQSMAGPDLGSLPIRITRGSARRQWVGGGIVLLALAWGLYSFHRASEVRHWDLGALFLPFVLFEIGIQLLKLNETTIDRFNVTHTSSGPWGRRAWSEPLGRYAGLDLEEIQSDESAKAEVHSYALVLRHSTEPKKNVALQRFRLTYPQAQAKAADVARLLALPVGAPETFDRGPSAEGLPPGITVEQTGSGVRILLPAARIRPLLVMGIFFCLMGMGVFVLSLVALRQGPWGVVPLLISLVPLGLGVALASGYWFAREEIELSETELRHHGLLFKWRKKDAVFPRAEITGVALPSVRRNGTLSTPVRVSRGAQSMDLAPSATPAQQQWLYRFLSSRLVGPERQSTHQSQE
jgi:hypothetical protein